jgi:hypothetical protein
VLWAPRIAWQGPRPYHPQQQSSNLLTMPDSKCSVGFAWSLSTWPVFRAFLLIDGSQPWLLIRITKRGLKSPNVYTIRLKKLQYGTQVLVEGMLIYV